MSREPDRGDQPEDPDEPKEPRRSPINPFEAARKRPSTPDIRVGWSTHDLQILRPDWTPRQCERFMLRHGQKFAAGMVRLGLSVLASMADDPRFTDGIIPPQSGNGDGKDGPHLPAPDS